MLKRENDLRLSDVVQHRFAEAERSGSADWMVVADEVQKEVLVEFNVEPTQEALLAYRCAANKYGISFYVKHNRSHEGVLKVGSEAPEVDLFSCDAAATPTSILALQRLDRPLIVVAGSLS